MSCSLEGRNLTCETAYFLVGVVYIYVTCFLIAAGICVDF